MSVNKKTYKTLSGSDLASLYEGRSAKELPANHLVSKNIKNSLIPIAKSLTSLFTENLKLEISRISCGKSLAWQMEQQADNLIHFRIKLERPYFLSITRDAFNQLLVLLAGGQKDRQEKTENIKGSSVIFKASIKQLLQETGKSLNFSSEKIQIEEWDHLLLPDFMNGELCVDIQFLMNRQSFACYFIGKFN